MNDAAIDVRGLNKHFGDKHVVNDVSLRVGRGETLKLRLNFSETKNCP